MLTIEFEVVPLAVTALIPLVAFPVLCVTTAKSVAVQYLSVSILFNLIIVYRGFHLYSSPVIMYSINHEIHACDHFNFAHTLLQSILGNWSIIHPSYIPIHYKYVIVSYEA